MSSSPSNASRYRVNGLLVDLGTCEVTHGSKVIALPKLSFDLLASLIRNAPNVVTMDELIVEVWDGRIVAEETVTQRVKLLRDALADAGYDRQIVTTVRGRGYRLASPVEPYAEAPPARGFAVGTRIAFIGTAIAVLLFGFLQFSRDPAPQPIDERSIAVLPFVDFSAENKLGYIGDGIAEELLQRFAQIPELRVVSRTSSFAFRDPSIGVTKIAEELGVGTVLEGSVREHDGRLRITVQLIDANADRHIWSESYDTALADVLEIQGQVADNVVERLRLSRPLVSERNTVQLGGDAVDLYLRGRHLLRERTASSLEEAIAHFRQVIEIEPEYASAHAAMAQAVLELSRRGNLPIDEAERRAGQAVRRALELDNRLADGHAVLGNLRLSTGDSIGAEAAFRHAIELNANHVESTLWLGYLLRAQGEFSAARAQFERTLMLDPMNVAALDALAFDMMNDGDYDAVIRQFERRIRISQGNAETFRLMAMTARTFGRLDDAVRWAQESVNVDPQGPLNVNELILAYSAIGATESAQELSRLAYSQAPDNHWVALGRAFTLINGGSFDELQQFAAAQLAAVQPDSGGMLSQSDRVRLAISGLAYFFSADYEAAQQTLELALGDPLTSVLEPQLTIGLLGALAYSYEKNGDESRFRDTLHVVDELIEDQQGWVNQHLIYADSKAAVQLMRGDRDAAIATMREAIGNGWTAHPGILHAPLWRDLYDTDSEFRAMIDDVLQHVEQLRNAVNPANDSTASA